MYQLLVVLQLLVGLISFFERLDLLFVAVQLLLELIVNPLQCFVEGGGLF